MKKGTLHKVNLMNERHAELPSCLGNASDTPADQLLLWVYAIANISQYIVQTWICTSQSLTYTCLSVAQVTSHNI